MKDLSMQITVYYVDYQCYYCRKRSFGSYVKREKSNLGHLLLYLFCFCNTDKYTNIQVICFTSLHQCFESFFTSLPLQKCIYVFCFHQYLLTIIFHMTYQLQSRFSFTMRTLKIIVTTFFYHKITII